TSAAREAGSITVRRGGIIAAQVPLTQKPRKQQFSGGVDQVDIQGALAVVYELCFTPGWSCIHFEAQTFPQAHSGEVSYAGVTLVSDGAMTVDVDTLEIDPPPENPSMIGLRPDWPVAI